MSPRLCAVLGLAVTLAAVPARAQSPTPQVEKYENGAIKSQTTTTMSADGKTKVREVRTEYDKDGRPTFESDITYQNGARPIERHEQTWVYDDKGRLTYYEFADWTAGGANVPGLEHRYRLRKSYNGDKDIDGTIESERDYSSTSGQWRDFDTEGGDVRPSMTPSQPLPQKPKPAETPKPQFPPPNTPLGEPFKAPTPSPPSEGLPLPPPKVRINGNILWERTPSEVSENNFGFGGAVAFGLTPRLAVVGDVSQVSGSDEFDETFSRLNLFGGVQWALPEHRRAQPFARAMVGVVLDSTDYGEGSTSGHGFALAFGVGVNFAIHGRIGAVAAFDYAPTHFTGQWQQPVMVSGGVSYDLVPGDAGPHDSGAVPVSLENPYASALARDGAEYRKTKGPNDKAQAEVEKADPAWLKKNLTAEGQTDVADAKAQEADAQKDFDKAADALTEAQRQDAQQQTFASGEIVAKARVAVKDADIALKAAHQARIRVTKKGFTKAARAYYEKIFDAHWENTKKYDDTKEKYDKWNKDHGVK